MALRDWAPGHVSARCSSPYVSLRVGQPTACAMFSPRLVPKCVSSIIQENHDAVLFSPRAHGLRFLQELVIILAWPPPHRLIYK